MRRNLSLALILVTALPAGCSRTRELSDEVWQEAVTAFHVSLAAMQTSQDVLARQQLERLIELVPDEPAGHANLALLLMRQQQLDEAMPYLSKAAELAPEHAGIARLQAVAEELRGNFDGAIEHWRRALRLNPSDARAEFALARELERRGDSVSNGEARLLLRSLVERTSNLAARLEQARLASRMGDAETLRNALAALDASASGWPPEARERLNEVREAAFRSPAEASTPLVFLRNVLQPTPEYRSAIRALTPVQELGDPLVRLVAIRNPDPHPAPADTSLTFAVDEQPALSARGVRWVGVVWLTGERAPAVAAATDREVHLSTGAVLPLPRAASAPAPPGPDGVLAADLNYDFRIDLVLATAGGLGIHVQGENGGFTEVTRAARVPSAVAGGRLYGVWAADIDTDGDLDLVVAPESADVLVLRNNGDGTFASRNPFRGVRRARGFAWADFDGEGVPDAALLDADGRLRVFLNLRSGEFSEQRLPGTPPIAAVTAADANGDGRLDVVALTRDGAVISLSPRDDGQGWERAELSRIDIGQDLAPGAARLLTGDLDNNGAFDLIVSHGDAARVALGGALTGVSGARPQTAPFTALDSVVPLRVLDVADVDGNGRLDLVGIGSGAARIARSRGDRAYRWQSIRPRAATVTGDQRVNSFGIGGEIEIRTGLHAQMRPITSPAVHFGLGGAVTAEVARVIWPNGFVQSEFDLAADTTILASQRLKGSCPWLFAWNGREMAFVTDFIWRSPLGLRINAQDTADVAMTEDRVKIRGDQLAPRDGVYDVRITAELWETHFFDQVSLLVVDHPEGTEIFVDERFAVPPPPLDVRATSPVRAFSVVRDDSGRDVSEVVRARDDRHLDFAGRGAYQGVTRDHYIELELPDDAPREGPLWLVGQGWMHPTDSSINVSLGQGTHSRPKGLSLHVADADGRFRVVHPDLGFPAGKDKTILVDLTGIFPSSGARRLRLSTNLEVFWDRLGWAAGKPAAPLQIRRLEPATAELRYRGYSVTEQKDASTPERPRYVIEGTAPRWFDLEGFHTRFGDVRELLMRVDDRYVIMNAGDELLLTFPEAPPPAPGMVRDFVVVGDGWEKDGDFNTTASRTVGPLPSHDQPRYDKRALRLSDDPVYRRYPDDFENYHTRWVSPLIRRALRPNR